MTDNMCRLFCRVSLHLSTMARVLLCTRLTLYTQLIAYHNIHVTSSRFHTISLHTLALYTANCPCTRSYCGLTFTSWLGRACKRVPQ